MDESAYRSARGEINRLPCVFEKALLAQHAVCQLAARHAVAERETIACTSPLARVACGELSALLREKSAFALRLPHTQRILPHAQVMKIQCGGLQGLQRVLDPEAPAPDVHHLVRMARQAYGELAALPFSEIVKGVAAFQLRKRHAPEGRGR
jgi:hypothetical protein